MSATVVLVSSENSDCTKEIVERARDDSWSIIHVSDVDRMRETLHSTAAAVVLVEAAMWEHEKIRTTLAKEWAALPVVVLTGGDESSAKLIQHLQLGAALYIPRRSTPREFRSTIRGLIDLSSRNPHRELVRPYLHAGQIELRLDNDLSAVAVVVGFVQNLMDGYHVADHATRIRLGVALSESLSNAIIHGNLEVSSDLRENGGDAYFEAIEHRSADPAYSKRVVTLVVRFDRESIMFVVTDEGPGFNVADVADPTDPENVLKCCGRGILMMRAYTDELAWNPRGNEVTMVKRLPAHPAKS